MALLVIRYLFSLCTKHQSICWICIAAPWCKSGNGNRTARAQRLCWNQPELLCEFVLLVGLVHKLEFSSPTNGAGTREREEEPPVGRKCAVGAGAPVVGRVLWGFGRACGPGWAWPSTWLSAVTTWVAEGRWFGTCGGQLFSVNNVCGWGWEEEDSE